MTTETSRLYVAKKGPTLADLMLARGAQLPTVAPRAAEQAVPAAEVITEAEQVTAEAAEDVTTCTHAACLNALHDECECACGGIGHGAATQVRAAAARAKAQARFDRAGGAMEYLRRAGGLAADIDEQPW